jgi:ketosteroid isomerase-like protein
MSTGAMDQKTIVLEFNECINRRDVDGLARLMTNDHVFIDSSGQAQKGKELMRRQWQGFFDHFPDYKNHFSTVELRGSDVFVVGRSTCSFGPLNGPALWTAKIREGLVAEWRVYDDTAENRKLLNLNT